MAWVLVGKRQKCSQRDAIERRGILEDRPLRRGEDEIAALDRVAVKEVVSAFVEYLVEPGCQDTLHLGLAALVVRELAARGDSQGVRSIISNTLSRLAWPLPPGCTRISKALTQRETTRPSRRTSCPSP